MRRALLSAVAYGILRAHLSVVDRITPFETRSCPWRMSPRLGIIHSARGVKADEKLPRAEPFFPTSVSVIVKSYRLVSSSISSCQFSVPPNGSDARREMCAIMI